MPGDPIGEIPIIISGDTSQLEKDFQRAVDMAIKAGLTLSEAIGKATATTGYQQQGFDAASKAAYQFSEAAQAIVDKQKALDLELVRAKGALVDIQLAYELGATNADTLARAQDNVAAAMKRAAASVEEVKPPVQEVAGGLSSMAEGFLKIGAALAVTATLKHFGEEAIEAYGEVQKLSLSLQALTGKTAEQVERDIDALKAFALTVGVAGHSIEQADQRMIAFGVDAAQIPGILQAEADAAAAVNKNFDVVAASIERMAESGKVMSRSLVAVGLSAHDLAEVLGVADKEIGKAFEGLTQSQRLDALAEALHKFEGVAAASSKGIAGSLVNLKTQINDTFEDIGKQIAPTVANLAKMLSEDILPAIRNLAIGFGGLPEPAKAAAGGLLAVAAAAWAVNAVPWVALATAVLAGTAALVSFWKAQDNVLKNRNTENNAVALLEVEMRQLGIDIADTTKQYNQGLISQASYINQLKDLKAAHEAMSGTSKKRTAEIVAENAATEAAKKSYAEMVKAEVSFHNSVVDLYNTFPETYEQYVSRLEEGGRTAKSMLGSVEADILKADSLMVGMRGAPLAAMQEWRAELVRMRDTAKEFADSDAFYKIAQKVTALTEKFQQEAIQLGAADVAIRQFFERMKAGAESVPDALKKISTEELLAQALKGEKEFGAQSEATAKTLTEAWLKYEQQVRKVASVQTPITTPLEQRFGPDQQDILGQIKLVEDLRGVYKTLGLDAEKSGTVQLAAFDKLFQNFDFLAERGAADLETVQLAWAKVSGQINKIAQSDLPKAIEEQSKYIDLLARAGASQGQIAAQQERELEWIIREKTARNESVTEYMILLKQVQLAEDARIERLQFFGKLYGNLMDDFQKSFEMVGKSIADNIVDAKDWGDVWKGVVKSIEKMFLETLIGSAFKLLGAEIIRVTGLAAGLAKVFGVSGAVAGAGNATSGAGGLLGLLGLAKKTGASPVNLPGEMPVGGDIDFSQGATGGAGGSGGAGGGAGGLGSLGGVLGIAGLGVSVASGIATGIQLAHIESDVAKIEISTRQAKEQLTGGIQFALNTWLPKLDHLTDGWAALQKIVDVLQYGLINVNIASATGGMDIAAAVAGQRTENGKRNLETGGQTGYQGEVVDPMSDPAVTRFVNNVAKLGRGLADLNTSVETIARTTARNASGYQLKAGEFFSPPVNAGMTPGGSLKSIYDRFASELGLSVEQVNANIRETITEGIKRGWVAEGTTIQEYLLGAGLKTSATQTSGSGFNIVNGVIKLDLDSPFTQFKLGNIDAAEFQRRVDQSTAAYQAAMMPAAEGAIEQRRASDPMVQAMEAATRAHFDLFNSTRSLQTQVDAAQRSFYLANSGTALYDLARQIGPDAARQQAAINAAALGSQTNSLGSGVALQGGLGPGATLPAFSDAQIQTAMSAFQQQLGTLVAVRQQQDSSALAQQAAWKSSEQLFENLKAAGNSLETIAQYYKVQVAGLLEQYYKGQISYEQYGQGVRDLMPLGGLVGNQLALEQYRTGKLSFEEYNQKTKYLGERNYASTPPDSRAPPSGPYAGVPYGYLLQDQLSLLQSKTIGSGTFGDFFTGGYVPSTPTMGGAVMGGNALRGGGGYDVYAPITQNVYTNDPQVVANSLTTSLWGSGFKTR